MITASVPSEPTSSPVRSYPAEVFGAFAPVRITLPARKHRLEREHVRTHLPVANRRRAGRVRRGHPAERCVGSRIDGEHQPVGAGGRVECAASRAWLHHGEQVGGLDLDPVHPAQIEADAACERDHVSLEAGPCAEGGHGDAPLVCELEDARDLQRRGWVDDEIRPAGSVEGQVGGVQVALGVAGRDPRRIVEHRRDGVRE